MYVLYVENLHELYFKVFAVYDSPENKGIPPTTRVCCDSGNI